MVKRFQRMFPSKNIVLLPLANAKEIICETHPTSEHAEWSEAVAAIEKSEPHKHVVSVEDYEVIEGELFLVVNGVKNHLRKGEKFRVVPGEVHWAEGNATLVKVVSHPGWTPEDHILV